MRRSLAPMLFDDPDPAAREAQRSAQLAKAEPSPAAQRKAARKRTDPAQGEPLPVHSFHTLLGDFAIDRLTPVVQTISMGCAQKSAKLGLRNSSKLRAHFWNKMPSQDCD